jgi:hypothetical protein
MIIGDAKVSTTEQNLALEHDNLKPAFDASVDPTDARNTRVSNTLGRCSECHDKPCYWPLTVLARE